MSTLQAESDQLIDIEVIDTNKIFVNSIKNSKVILPILGEPKNNFVKNNSKPKLRLLAKGENPKNFIYKFKNKIISLEEISSAASGIGSISLIPSIDGVIRNVPVLYNIDDKLWPSLALETVRIATGQKNLLVKSDKNGIELIKTRKNIIPSDQNAVINVKFNKFSKDNYVSAVDVMNNDFDQKKVENKIILIGSSAQALFDIVKIANGKYVPGVEIHAHIIDNILKNIPPKYPRYQDMQRLTDLMINSFNAIGEADSAKYYGLIIKSMFPTIEANIDENNKKLTQVFKFKQNTINRGPYIVQIGAFSNKENAKRALDQAGHGVFVLLLLSIIYTYLSLSCVSLLEIYNTYAPIEAQKMVIPPQR